MGHTELGAIFDSHDTRPDRRHIWNGLYLPCVTSEGVGEVAIAVRLLGLDPRPAARSVRSEVRSILAGQQLRLVHVLYFDSEVHRHEIYQAGQSISPRSVASSLCKSAEMAGR